MEQVIEKLRTLIKNETNQNIDADVLDLDLSLGIQGIDSLDQSAIFMSIEDEFGVKFSDAEIEQNDTIRKIAETIVARS